VTSLEGVWESGFRDWKSRNTGPNCAVAEASRLRQGYGAQGSCRTETTPACGGHGHARSRGPLAVTSRCVNLDLPLGEARLDCGAERLGYLPDGRDCAAVPEGSRGYALTVYQYVKMPRGLWYIHGREVHGVGSAPVSAPGESLACKGGNEARVLAGGGAKRKEPGVDVHRDSPGMAGEGPAGIPAHVTRHEASIEGVDEVFDPACRQVSKHAAQGRREEPVAVYH